MCNTHKRQNCSHGRREIAKQLTRWRSIEVSADASRWKKPHRKCEFRNPTGDCRDKNRYGLNVHTFVHTGEDWLYLLFLLSLLMLGSFAGWW
jgi:hypothetical protein